MESINLARFFVDYLSSQGAGDSQIIQAKNSKIFNHIVVCTAGDKLHAQNLLVGLLEFAQTNFNIVSGGIEGYKRADWIVMDYGKLQVHIMSQKAREKYNIEKLWA